MSAAVGVWHLTTTPEFNTFAVSWCAGDHPEVASGPPMETPLTGVLIGWIVLMPGCRRRERTLQDWAAVPIEAHLAAILYRLIVITLLLAPHLPARGHQECGDEADAVLFRVTSWRELAVF